MTETWVLSTVGADEGWEPGWTRRHSTDGRFSDLSPWARPFPVMAGSLHPEQNGVVAAS